MASYVFVIYYGEVKQRKYTQRHDGKWFYAERTMRFSYGTRRGWHAWSDWQQETGNVYLITHDRLQTPIGDAHRTNEIVQRIFVK